jgi:hypothetical protein
VNPENPFATDFFCDTRLANTETWYLIPPADFNMRVPDSIRKCVVYLGIEIPDGDTTKIIWGGTGFLVGMPSEKIPQATFGYLVTAHHVAIKFKGRDFFIRVNLKDGGSFNLKAPKDAVQWFFHPNDAAADVAVCRLTPPDKVDFLGLPISMFLTEENRKAKGIGIGNEVFITGLFAHHKGNAKNIPIVRMGNVAMISEERVLTKDYGQMEAYLIELRSTGGISGSPVFVVEEIDPLDSKIHLMGLIHGHWYIHPETIIDYTIQDAGTKAGINVGVAIVTPASKILDVLNCDDLASWRQKAEADWLSKNSPTPDKQ